MYVLLAQGKKKEQYNLVVSQDRRVQANQGRKVSHKEVNDQMKEVHSIKLDLKVKVNQDLRVNDQMKEVHNIIKEDHRINHKEIRDHLRVEQNTDKENNKV